MSTFEELKQEILNQGCTEHQANEFLKTVEPESIMSPSGFIHSKIDEIKSIEEIEEAPTADAGVASVVEEEQPQEEVEDAGLASATSEKATKASPLERFQKYENSPISSLKNGYAKLLKKYEAKEKANKSFTDEIKKMEKLEYRELVNIVKANPDEVYKMFEKQNNQN